MTTRLFTNSMIFLFLTLEKKRSTRGRKEGQLETSEKKSPIDPTRKPAGAVPFRGYSEHCRLGFETAKLSEIDETPGRR